MISFTASTHSRRLLTAVLACLLLTGISLPVTRAASPIAILLNGKPLTFDVPPAIVNGRTLVPLRAIFEALKVPVVYTPETRTIVGQTPRGLIILTIDRTDATVYGRTVRLEVPPTVINGRTMVPLRFISEVIGAEVKYDPGTHTVSITMPDATSAQTPGPELSTSPAEEVKPPLSARELLAKLGAEFRTLPLGTAEIPVRFELWTYTDGERVVVARVDADGYEAWRTTDHADRPVIRPWHAAVYNRVRSETGEYLNFGVSYVTEGETRPAGFAENEVWQRQDSTWVGERWLTWQDGPEEIAFNADLPPLASSSGSTAESEPDSDTPITSEGTGGAPEGWFRVSGVLRDAVSRDPIPGVKIMAKGTGGLPLTYTTTSGGDGSYKIDLPASSAFKLTVDSSCYQSGDWIVSQTTLINLNAPPVSPSTEKPLPDGYYRVFGVVRDQAGKPQKGVCLTSAPSLSLTRWTPPVPPADTATTVYMTGTDGVYYLDWPQWHSMTIDTARGGCEPTRTVFQFSWNPPGLSPGAEGGPMSGGGPQFGGTISYVPFYWNTMPREPHIQRDIALRCEAEVTTPGDPPVAKVIRNGETATSACTGTIGTSPAYTRVTRSRSWVAAGDGVDITAYPISDQQNVVLRWWLDDRYNGTLYISGCNATYVAPEGYAGGQTSLNVFVSIEGKGKAPTLGNYSGQGFVRILLYPASSGGGTQGCTSVPVTFTAMSQHGGITRISIQGVGTWNAGGVSTATVTGVPPGRYTVTVTTAVGGTRQFQTQVGCPRTTVKID